MYHSQFYSQYSAGRLLGAICKKYTLNERIMASHVNSSTC